MLTSSTVSSIEFYLNKLKDRFGLRRITDPTCLYPYFTDICPQADLKAIESSLDLKKIFNSAVPSALAIDLQNPSKDKSQLISESAKELTKLTSLPLDDSIELCTLIAHVVTGSASISSSSSSTSSTRSNPKAPSDFILVPEDTTKHITNSAFYICKHQVTQREYEDIMGYNPSYFKNKSIIPLIMFLGLMQ